MLASDTVRRRGSSRLAAIVLAAGGSTRMGRQKLLLEGAEGSTLIRETLNKVLALDLSDLVVVEGPDEPVGLIARGLGARTIVNEHWEEGIGSSIRLAIAALGENADAVLILLGDQPRITLSDLESLVDVWRKSPALVVATSYPEGGGVPAVFARDLFEKLLRLEGDRGARELIRSLENVELVEITDTRDVDDPESYERVVRDEEGRVKGEE